MVQLTDDGSRAAAVLVEDELELARYLFAGRASAELRRLAAGFDQVLERLDDPAFEALRRQARQRWPLSRHERFPDGNASAHSRGRVGPPAGGATWTDDDMVEMLGRQEYERMRAERRLAISALEAGLLWRSLFIACRSRRR